MKILLPALTLSLLVSGAGVGYAVGAADAPAPVTVSREPLAASSEVRGAPDRSLALTRITVMPGSLLASHHHPGTQIARIANGTLTYSVETGRVRVMRGDAEDGTFVRTIKAGETGRIRTGQWIVEQPDEVHHAANLGTEPVVIYLATLFPTGAPASIAD
jgi:quercetin dioxygenase-like cupin family protein